MADCTLFWTRFQTRGRLDLVNAGLEASYGQTQINTGRKEGGYQ